MFIKNLKKLTVAVLAVACMIPAGVSSANVESVTRIAGKDRIGTSLEISKAMFNESDNVVLASGFNFADALSAGQLAAALNAPLILSNDQLDSRTSDEIAKLKPKNMYIVGGENALSSNIEESVKSVVNDINIERLKGNDRYETSVKVMEKTKEFVDAEYLLIASGKNFPDALSATSFMADHKALMVLSDGNSYPKSNLKEIAIGGVNQLPLNGFTGERIAGNDRYQTALAIAKRSFESNENAILANSKVFADSLSAVSVAKNYKAPIILTDNENLTQSAKSYLENMKSVTIVGGEKSVSSNIFSNPTAEEVSEMKRLENERKAREEQARKQRELELKKQEQAKKEASKPTKPNYIYQDGYGPVGEGRIKGNMNSMIYHLPGQRDYNKIKLIHIRYFKTEKEARAAGFRRALR
ncbi:putative cell wall binding repeat 2 [Finegoldia magna SY403409CC001050417]|uniref:Cell wall-binding repeat-containing protein n=1 Tax=Finegoldia magna TaxID=1260 RepID=A0A7D4FLF6_FINMA|nr:cell wall-binding repeat-containing protein [Finegoldia magna]EGS32985.1 putative cell wall binding repeat 2 [Finegoldia magna SY403409CC001050417]QKH79225.1 cell wall-binding repeat-containing protein [Finegoldia magna]